MSWYIIQGLGLLGLLIGFLGPIRNKKTEILAYLVVSDTLFIIQYILLGSVISAMIVTVGIANIILCHLFNNNRYITIIASVLMTATGIYEYDSIVTLLPVVGSIIIAFAVRFNKPKHIRFASIPGYLLWVINGLLITAWSSAIGDFITFLGIIIGIIKYDIPRRKEIANGN